MKCLPVGAANINLQGLQLHSTRKLLKTCHVVEEITARFQAFGQENQLENGWLQDRAEKRAMDCPILEMKHSARHLIVSLTSRVKYNASIKFFE